MIDVHWDMSLDRVDDAVWDYFLEVGCRDLLGGVVRGCDLIDKLTLGTSPGTYSFRNNLQCLSIHLQASLSVITLCDALILQSLKHTSLMCRIGQRWQPLSDGRLSICLPLKTSR